LPVQVGWKLVPAASRCVDSEYASDEYFT